VALLQFFYKTDRSVQKMFSRQVDLTSFFAHGSEEENSVVLPGVELLSVTSQHITLLNELS